MFVCLYACNTLVGPEFASRTFSAWKNERLEEKKKTHVILAFIPPAFQRLWYVLYTFVFLFWLVCRTCLRVYVVFEVRNQEGLNPQLPSVAFFDFLLCFAWIHFSERKRNSNEHNRAPRTTKEQIWTSRFLTFAVYRIPDIFNLYAASIDRSPARRFLCVFFFYVLLFSLFFSHFRRPWRPCVKTAFCSWRSALRTACSRS